MFPSEASQVLLKHHGGAQKAKNIQTYTKGQAAHGLDLDHTSSLNTAVGWNLGWAMALVGFELSR